jgi:hypothetical protein
MCRCDIDVNGGEMCGQVFHEQPTVCSIRGAYADADADHISFDAISATPTPELVR